MEDYEKLYKNAVKRIQTTYQDDFGCVHVKPEEIFPELKESEDERIRKRIIEFLSTPFVKKGMSEGALSTWIAWLEKQGKKIDAIENFDTEFEKQVSHLVASTINKEYEYTSDFVKWTANALLNYAKHELEKQVGKKPVDKAEPKFKVGDTIRGKYDNREFTIKAIDLDRGFYTYTQEGCGNDIDYADEVFELKVEPKFKVEDWITNSIETVQITGYDIDYGYQVDYEGNLQHRDTDIIEKEYHLWTIQDAKDGDILVTSNGGIFIFDNTVEDGIYPFAYCGLTKHHGFEVYDRKLPFTHDNDVRPATEEQRDLLFFKMKEAGYEWDAEKKELKKIEQKLTWSEEEKARIDKIIDVLDWAEEKGHIHHNDWEDYVCYVKSLKPQNTWKPSGEQMEVLYKYAEQNNYDGSVLTSLYRDLKKLREE